LATMGPKSLVVRGRTGREAAAAVVAATFTSLAFLLVAAAGGGRRRLREADCMADSFVCRSC
jgi:hypothetical protein